MLVSTAFLSDGHVECIFSEFEAEGLLTPVSVLDAERERSTGFSELRIPA